MTDPRLKKSERDHRRLSWREVVVLDELVVDVSVDDVAQDGQDNRVELDVPAENVVQPEAVCKKKFHAILGDREVVFVQDVHGAGIDALLEMHV